MRKVYAALALAAAVTAGGAGGYALHTHPTTPRPCTFDGGGRIASGDAARTDTGVWVCTDGTLVHVTHYGNS